MQTGRRSPAPVLLLPLLVALLLGGHLSLARAQSATTRDLQAAFLINFARFTEWPPSRTAGTLHVCVVGDAALVKAISAAGRGQHINGRDVRASALRSNDAIDDCHMLFTDRRVTKEEAAAMLTRARDLPVLTVSDDPDFAAWAGIIELTVDQGRMRFVVNATSARRAGLRLSSRLLGLAKAVHGGQTF